jgi:cation transporter-like permease
MSTYLSLVILAVGSYALFRFARLRPLRSLFIAPLLATICFQVFVFVVEGGFMPMWEIALVTGYALCFVVCLVAFGVERLTKRAQSER